MVPATNTRLYMDDGDIPGHLEGRLPNLISVVSSPRYVGNFCIHHRQSCSLEDELEIEISLEKSIFLTGGRIFDRDDKPIISSCGGLVVAQCPL